MALTGEPSDKYGEGLGNEYALAAIRQAEKISGQKMWEGQVPSILTLEGIRTQAVQEGQVAPNKSH